MTAGGSAGHGSGADLPPLLLGKNMPKTRAGGVEKASPESAERKGPSRPRAGGVSSARAWAGGAGRAAPGVGRALRFPLVRANRRADCPGEPRGPALREPLKSFRNRLTLSTVGLFPCFPVPFRRQALGSAFPPCHLPRPVVLSQAAGRSCLFAFNSQWK